MRFLIASKVPAAAEVAPTAQCAGEHFAVESYQEDDVNGVVYCSNV